MTTLALSSIRRADRRELLVGAGFALWFALAMANWLGVLLVPPAALTRPLLLVGVPIAAVAVVFLREPATRTFPVAAGMSIAVPVAMFFAFVIEVQPQVAFVVPAVCIAAVAVHRFPLATFSVIFLASSAYGTITAFTPVPPAQVVDGLLGGLWAGILGRTIIQRRPAHLRITPAFVLLAALLVLSVVFTLAAQPLDAGMKDFRLSYWHMSAVLLIGYGGFRAATIFGLTRAAAFICLLIAAYSCFRWAVGPAAKEQELLTGVGEQYNKLGITGEEKVKGSFPAGSELGAWMACAIPFLVALVITWCGRTRLVAMAALPFAIVGLLGSGQRTAAAAVIAGILTVVVLHLLSRGFHGPRLGVALAAVATFIGAAAVAYPAVLDDPEQRKRYENLLTPSQDLPVQERLVKWRAVIAAVKSEPFGFGMGTGHPAAIPTRFVRAGASDVDSTYLKVAYQQGFLVMGFFILTLIVLLVEMVRYAVWTRAPQSSALTSAAAGTLVAIMVEFVAGMYIDTLAILVGWMIVGLGVSQFNRPLEPEAEPAPA